MGFTLVQSDQLSSSSPSNGWVAVCQYFCFFSLVSSIFFLSFFYFMISTFHPLCGEQFSPLFVYLLSSAVNSYSILSVRSTFRHLLLPVPFRCSFSLSLPSNQSASLFEICVSILWMSLPFQLHKMKQLRAVYPEKTVYTQQVGPGCCFGALALMLRFYFEVTIILKLILSHKHYNIPKNDLPYILT